MDYFISGTLKTKLAAQAFLMKKGCVFQALKKRLAISIIKTQTTINQIIKHNSSQQKMFKTKQARTQTLYLNASRF